MNSNKFYYAYTDCLYNPIKYQKYYQQLTKQRRERVDRLLDEKAKKLSVLAETLLRFVLNEQGITDFAISTLENGKPFLLGGQKSFNLSHSHDICVCAVSDVEIGCDVEKIAKANLKIGERFFSKTENAYLSSLSADKESQEFYRLWTLKESYVKAIGKGLFLPLNSFDVVDEKGQTKVITYNQKDYYFKSYRLDNDYKAAVCSQSNVFDDAMLIEL